MRTNRWIPLSFAVALVAYGRAAPAKAPDQSGASVGRACPTAAASPANTSSSVLTAIGANAGLGSSPGLLADNAGAPMEAQAALTDDQILGFTHAANVGEIAQGKLAEDKATDARVKKLGWTMVKDHTEADAKGATLAKTAKLAPSTSPTSHALEADARAATRTLRSKMGTDFDNSYVDTQIKEHQSVLDTLDQKLIPSARNPDLKAYLAEARAVIARHLEHAQALQQEMQK